MAKLREKGLSESSIKLYLRNLEKLNDDKPLANLNFLKKKKEIMEKLESKKPNTKRNYIISIVSVLQTDPSMKKTYDQYFADMKDINKVLKEAESKNEKSETQKNNWIDWKDVLEVYEKYKSEVKKISSLKNINQQQYNILLAYLILSLYVLFPARRNADYQNMFIIKNMKVPDDDKNYADLTNKKFYFRKYKTAKTEGEQEFDIPADLADVIELFLKHYPNLNKKTKKICVPLLVNYDGQRLDKINSITLLLNKIFKKKISSSMLRHIYTSYRTKELLIVMLYKR